MIRPAPTLAVARAELQLTRRLVRYWVFVVFAWLLGLPIYFYYAAIHAFLSSVSATIGSIGPRYLMAGFGLYSVAIFQIGFVFLGFDVRRRDERERMVEVIDCRPLTNLELLCGRFFALLLAGWLPVTLMVLTLQAFGLLLPALGLPVGEPIEPVSLLTYSIFMIPPAFAVALALVFLVTLLVRNRLVAALLLLVLLGVDFWATLYLPFTLVPLVDLSGAYVINALSSSIVPAVGDAAAVLQRLGVLVVAGGLLGLAAAVHPRLDGGSRRRTTVGGLLILVVGIGLMAVPVEQRTGQLRQLEQWRLAHAARVGEPIADLVAMTATVDLQPGRSMSSQVELRLRAPADTALSSLLLSLNPGLAVSEVTGQDGAGLAFSHDNGLLEITLPAPLAAAAETTLTLRCSGRPDTRFAYLDAPTTPMALAPINGQIFLLGVERAIFDRRYVALMPGIRWLPATGPEVGRDDLRTRPLDLFTIDLSVSLPAGWLAAGPGRRQTTGSDSSSFRFAPPAPVPEACLIASRFTSRSAEIEGVHLELLVHPAHTRNLAVLADAAEELQSLIRERLVIASEAGLPYPYDGFTLVEVPTTLRGFGGGWRMATAMAPPAMVLMRESGFPTARFDVPFRDPQAYTDREGGRPRAKRDRVYRYFLNDFSGGNLAVGAARSFFLCQTAATGPEALALNFVLEDLTTHLVGDTRGYFSAHLFSPELNQTVLRTMQALAFGAGRDGKVGDAVIAALTSRPQVWQTVLEGSLVELDPQQQPQQTLDALTLKGGSLAQALYDLLGSDQVGHLLAELRRRHLGESFTLADLQAAGAGLDSDLSQLLGDWLTTTSLPGFVGEPAQAFRLPDAEDGSPRYQLLATVRNDEPVPGFLRLVYQLGEGEDRERVESEPIRIGGQQTIRFAAVVSRPPAAIWVDPYVSLNRDSFRLPLPQVDEEQVVASPPLTGVAKLPWQLPAPAIVVDDLDEGFAVAGGDSSGGLRLGVRSRTTKDLDQGLPVQLFDALKPEWSRGYSASAWGRYRHTFAYLKPGKGQRSASFTTTLPATGEWQLELHLPHKQRFERMRRITRWGTWQLQVTGSNGQEHPLDFDATAAPSGWSRVASLPLADGSVTVTLADRSTGGLVIADAIRWTRAARSTTAATPTTTNGGQEAP